MNKINRHSSTGRLHTYNTRKDPEVRRPTHSRHSSTHSSRASSHRHDQSSVPNSGQNSLVQIETLMEEADMLRDYVETGQDTDNMENIQDRVSAIRQKYREREMKRAGSITSYFTRAQEGQSTPLKPNNMSSIPPSRSNEQTFESRQTSTVASVDMQSMLEEYQEEHEYYKEKLLTLLDANYAEEKQTLTEDIKMSEAKLLEYKDCYAPILNEIMTLETAATNEGEIEAQLYDLERQHAEKEQKYKAEVEELMAEIESLKNEASSETIIDQLQMLRKRVMQTEEANQNILSIINEL